jgi:hypothetical protein
VNQITPPLGIPFDSTRAKTALVATLRPETPIIDSVVRRWLIRNGAPPPFGGGASMAITYYEWLHRLITEMAMTPEARAWGRIFTDQFPSESGAEPVSAAKQLDFLIWAGADR